MRKLNVAILGATGAVGAELLEILFERDFPVGELRLLASERSAGRKLQIPEGDVEVKAVGPDAFEGIDVAFFSAGGSVSKEYAPYAVKSGAVVIDNTSAFRMDAGVPLVVPEVNPDDVTWHKGVIANPNCSTIIMCVALKPIYDLAGIKRIVVSTYQAVSGAGWRAMKELEAQVKAYVNGEDIRPEVLPVASGSVHHQIAFNLIPHIDAFVDDQYTKEEWKMVKETQKIFHDSSIAVTATTVRVPVFRSHSESINLELKRPLSPEKAREALSGAPGVKVKDDPANYEYPMPLFVAGKDEVYVGRIRVDRTVENGLNMWVVGDQIRKGAALNAIQIAELLIEKNLI